MLKTKAVLSNSVDTSTVRDYFSLLKPRVMSLVIFTGFIGLYIAPGSIHPIIGFIAILCIAIGSGAAGAINMWYERDIDCLMERTKNRPLPKQAMPPEEALNFGVGLSFVSVIIMGLFVNLVSASLLAVAILFYVFIYTIWLKRVTPQNIVIGGAAGALPPMIGWAAVTNNISLESFLLFLIIFMWTPPHFWALSLYKCSDYTNAGVPMMPVVRGIKYTQLQILVYSAVLFFITILPYYIGIFGKVYLFAALILGVIFMYLAYLVYYDENYKAAPKLFVYSIIYLFLLYASMPFDKLLMS
jgi:protoheme IX farnesyltransferase